MASTVQTLLLPKTKFSAASAREWAKRHGYIASGVDEGSATAAYLRIRQKAPDRLEGLKTISLGDGVKAVVGVPKRGARRNPTWIDEQKRKHPSRVSHEMPRAAGDHVAALHAYAASGSDRAAAVAALAYFKKLGAYTGNMEETIRNADAKWGKANPRKNPKMKMGVAAAFLAKKGFDPVGKGASTHSGFRFKVVTPEGSLKFIDVVADGAGNPVVRRYNPKKKRNPLPIPGGFEEPEKYTVGYGLPKEIRGTVPNVDPEGTDLSIWTWTLAGYPYAIAFSGRSSKPLWYHKFLTVDQRNRTIRESISAAKSRLKWKEEREEKKRVERSAPHGVKVGQIFVMSWGYSMTLADFFQVVSLTGKSSAIVREIGAERVSGPDSGGGERIMPVPGKFVGPPKRVLLRGDGFTTEKHRASPWNGKSVYINTYD